MKRLLIATLSLVMISSCAMAATTNSSATQTTYTEQFIQKHTQKITDAEKKLQEKQKANEDAWAKQKEQWKKDAQAKQDARVKQQQEWKNKIEAQKKALQIQQEFWEECMMVSNIVDLVRKLLRNLQNMQEFRYGMVLQTSIIRHR